MSSIYLIIYLRKKIKFYFCGVIQIQKTVVNSNIYKILTFPTRGIIFKTFKLFLSYIQTLNNVHCRVLNLK